MAKRRTDRDLDGLPMAVERRAGVASACVKYGDSWWCRDTMTVSEAERRLECLRRKLWFSRRRSQPSIIRGWSEGSVC